MNALRTLPGAQSSLALSAEREAHASQLLTQCELLRTILQSQSAILLLLKVATLRSIDEVEFALLRCDQWVADLAEQLHEASADNALARSLAQLVPALSETQRGLFALIARTRGAAGSVAEFQLAYHRLHLLTERAENLLNETSAELVSLNSGCACEIDSLSTNRGV